MANGGGTSPGEPGKPRITQEEKEHLMRLRWLWETGYQIDCIDGAWTARPHSDPGVTLTAEDGGEMWRVIVADNAERRERTGRGGYWIETCSGPPYYVAPQPHFRTRNSG
jgi:hypothetical protein